MNAATDRLAVHLLIGLSMLTRLALPALAGGGMAAFAGGTDPEPPACAPSGYAASCQDEAARPIPIPTSVPDREQEN